MAGVSFKPSRKGFETTLVAVSVCGGVIASLLAIVLLISGTTTIQTKGGGSHVLLKDLALVSFDGIIPNNETSEFLVRLHWFVGAFAWEYPNAPDGLPTAGITTTGPRLSANIGDSFRDIAAKLDLPRDDWTCPGYGPYVKPCDNLFFEAWRSWAVHGGSAIDGWMAWVMLVLAMPFTILTIAQEWMIRKRPYWMRCRCLILKSWCPCPKGTKEEIEKLDDFTWDKVRASYWAFAACYFLFATLHASLSRMFFLHTLDYIERRLPQGWSMNVRKGTAAPALFWCAVGFNSLSAFCMVVKWSLSRRPKGWMEEQSLGQLGDSAPENSEMARGEGNGRYTD